MKAIMVLVLVAATPLAGGVTVVREWSGFYELGVNYSVSDRVVTILEGSDPDIQWKFEAYDSETGDPADIRGVLINPTGRVGIIHLMIVGDADEGRLRGAANVGTIDLRTNADDLTYVDELDITGNLGTAGVVTASGAGALTIDGSIEHEVIFEQDISGPVTVGGAVNANFSVTHNVLQDVHLGTISARNTFFADTLQGALSLEGDGPHAGSIEIWTFENPALVDVTGSMTGSITIGAPT